MKKGFICALAVLMTFGLFACNEKPLPTEPTHLSQTQPLAPSETEPAETTPKETTSAETVTTEPLHSLMYIPGVTVEDLILYFNEVCLDSEIVHSGDPSYVQKWTTPIYYSLEGDYTDEDLGVLTAFILWLNGIDGFPGISQTEDLTKRNMRICFCDQETLLSLMGSDFENTDGGVTFWYNDNEIYDAIICYRTDVDQSLRNSVILEEIYNGLGPMQDTTIRTDSIIYQGFSQPQWLSPIDVLLLQLLYHPDILPGMNAQQCEQVIRSLYY